MIAIDPNQLLALSVQDRPGVYALLLGSGVSRSAGIPTGWDIVRDLIGRLAELQGGPSDTTDLVGWYRQKYDQEPEYSALLEAIAHTPEERQLLLRSYFEPNDAEREQGLKQPTAAHRAIAQLVARGLVRVIITTNFDRLIETALREAGVEPTVLSTPELVAGALPLIHTPCCVLKVHGDYLDPRILNSPAELSTYKPALVELLDQIFDQFGLIVCGWSADWDVALCKAMEQCKSRRFSWYWTERGAVSENAEKLIKCRDAHRIPIQDADDFFTNLQNQVEALLDSRRPHPVSTELAVAMVKHFLSRPEFRIQLSDLINEKTGQATRVIREAEQEDLLIVHGRADIAESACESLMAMAATAGQWMTEEHSQDWLDALGELLYATSSWPEGPWCYLDMYPASLVFWSLCAGAVSANRLDSVKSLLDSRHSTGRDNPRFACNANQTGLEEITIPSNITGTHLYPPGWNGFTGMDPYPARWTGFPGGIYKRLTASLATAMEHATYGNSERCRLSIDKVDVLWHLANARATIKGDLRQDSAKTLALVGQYRDNRLRINCNWENRRQIFEEFKGSIGAFGAESPLVKSRLFGDTRPEAMDCIEFVENLRGTAP